MLISDWGSDVCSSDLPSIQELTPDDTVNIFMPTTPNPTTGFLLFLPRRETQTLAMTVEEGIKMVVSGGIVTPLDRSVPAEAQSGAEPPLPRTRQPGNPSVARGRPRACVGPAQPRPDPPPDT